MLNDVFDYMGKDVRVIGNSENPLFCLKDVCDILELRVAKVIERLRNDINGERDEVLSKDLVSKQDFVDSKGRQQEMYFVTEEGLYDVILDSRKSIAKKFRKWVIKVIKQIRQDGFYEDEEWQELRDVGIEDRLTLTSAIARLNEYCDYHFIDSSKYVYAGADNLYSTISIMVNTTLGLGFINDRDDLSKKQLKMIDICENKLYNIIIKDINDHKHPKKIMKHIKKALNKLRAKFIEKKLLKDLKQVDILSYIDKFSDNDYEQT